MLTKDNGNLNLAFTNLTSFYSKNTNELKLITDDFRILFEQGGANVDCSVWTPLDSLLQFKFNHKDVTILKAMEYIKDRNILFKNIFSDSFSGLIKLKFYTKLKF